MATVGRKEGVVSEEDGALVGVRAGLGVVVAPPVAVVDGPTIVTVWATPGVAEASAWVLVVRGVVCRGILST